MLFWADAMHVTTGGNGTKRDIRGEVKKKPSGHQMKTISGGDVSTHVGHGNIGNHGNIPSVRTAAEPHPQQPVIRSSVSSGPPPLINTVGPPLITLPYKMHSESKIKVGGDYSGWASEIHALRLLGLGNAIDYRFAAGTVDASKTIIFQNCQPKIWYPDCRARVNSAPLTPNVHIYVVNIPGNLCSPLKEPNNHGMDDSMLEAFSCVLNYIRQKLPPIYVLETVKHLAGKTHTAAFDYTMSPFQMMKDNDGNFLYDVHWRVYDSQDFGVPHRRAWLYIVGIRQSAIKRRMEGTNFLELVLSSRKPVPPIRQYLGDRKWDRKALEGELYACIRGYPKTASRNLRMAIEELQAANLDPSKADIVVDLSNGHANDRVTMLHNVCPTITGARGVRDDFFLISVARRLNFHDYMKLQGLDPYTMRLSGPRNAEIGRLAGTSMTIPVLAVIFRAALLFTGLAIDV